MKKSLLRITLLVSLLLSLSGCGAALSGYMNNSAALSANNYTYVQQDLQGTAQATYVLGIGGMNREGIVAEAKKNMLENATLQDGQALTNTTVNFKYSSFLGIVSTTKCIVTADLVQFD